jgi:hypothetical protein
LDNPVNVPSVGIVDDDLWESRYLRRLPTAHRQGR